MRALSFRPSRTMVIKCLTVAGLGVLLGICFIGTFLQVKEYRNQAERATCAGHLTQIQSALWAYHDKYGHFPPAYTIDNQGKPAHSWRVLLLEFLDEELFKQYDFNERWDGPNNRQIAHRMPVAYDCTCVPSKASTLASNTLTNIVVVSGNGAVFNGAKPASLDDIKDRSTTILVVESINAEIHWMAPEDLPMEDNSFRLNNRNNPSISTNRTGGPLALFADGTKRTLDPSMTPENIRALVTIHGEDLIDPKALFLKK